MTWEEFRRGCAEPFEPEIHQHVELALYGEDPEPTIRLFPKDTTEYFTQDIYPAPDRYIKNYRGVGYSG